MPKLLMRSGKFVNPNPTATAWQVQANQIELLHDTYIGQLYDVLDTAQGLIEWDIAMARTDGTGAPGDVIPVADIELFG